MTYDAAAVSGLTVSRRSTRRWHTSAVVVVERRISPEDLERMLDEGELDYQYELELVDGEIIYLGLPSLYHNAVVLAILRLLFPFADTIGGRLFGEAAGFRTGPEGRNLRAPDVSLVTASRIAIVEGDGRWGLAAPDLAVEVLSPDQYVDAYARQKVPEYMAAGARVVWLVNPEARTVRAFYAARDDVEVYSGDAEITLDALAPGFRSSIAGFFPAR